MPSGGNGEELILDVGVEREEAMVNKSLMLSGGKDEELILDVASCRTRRSCDDIVFVEVAVGENASFQVVDDSTGDDA